MGTLTFFLRPIVMKLFIAFVLFISQAYGAAEPGPPGVEPTSADSFPPGFKQAIADSLPSGFKPSASVTPEKKVDPKEDLDLAAYFQLVEPESAEVAKEIAEINKSFNETELKAAKVTEVEIIPNDVLVREENVQYADDADDAELVEVETEDKEGETDEFQVKDEGDVEEEDEELKGLFGKEEEEEKDEQEEEQEEQEEQEEEQ